ncbi:MAG: phosphatase PAP2 family protein [Candidatus Micrarchaeia archaeon]
MLQVFTIEPYAIGINLAVLHFMKSIASPWFNQIMAAITQSYLLVLPLIALYMLAKKDKNVYVFAIAVVLFYVINDAIKVIVKEPRPCNTPELSWINAYNCEANYSFPSSHAAVLTGLPAFLGKYKYIRPLYIIWLLFVLFGKMYIGAHYFTDIVAGAALSLVMAYILYRYKDKINNAINRILKGIPFISIRE